MQKIKRILVAMDGSKGSFKALDMAISIARQFGSTMVGLCVIQTEPPVYMPGLKSSFKQKMTSRAKKFLEEAKKISEDNEVPFKYYIAEETPTRYIPEFVNNRDFDLVVIGGHAHSRMRELMLGSVAHSTVHRSRVSVLVVK